MPTLEQAAPVQGQHKGIIPSTEEARIRLDLAKQLETTIRERMNCKTWRFTASKLAVVFVMPLDLLRRMAESGKHPTRSYFTADFGLILASELAKELPLMRSTNPHDTNLPPRSQKRSWEDQPVRNEAEAQKCHTRDQHACVLTGTANPDACHIIPFSFNSTVDNLYFASDLISGASLFGDRPWWEFLSMRVRSSDRAWNMLAINPQLHFWWGKGLWAIRCLGISPVSAESTSKHMVNLQFRWMPKRSERSRNRKIHLEKGEGEEMLAELTTWHGDPSTQSREGGIIAASDAYSHRPLLSGHVFDVCLDNEEEAQNMKDMVDLQWSLIVVASLAGAADADDSEFPLEYERESEDDYAADATTSMMEVDVPHDNHTIQQWLEGLTLGTSAHCQPEPAP